MRGGILSLLFRGQTGRERERDGREKKKGRKKAWPKERGRDERGPKEHTALGARKKAILGGRRRRSRTGRVISRWNLVKQSSLLNDDDNDDDEDVARGLPGCLIKIEVVRCSPHPPSSHTFVLRRWRREREKKRRREPSERPTLVPPRLLSCLFPLHGFHVEACVSSWLHVCPSRVVPRRYTLARSCVRPSIRTRTDLCGHVGGRARASASPPPPPPPPLSSLRSASEYGSDTFLRQINKTKP